MLIQKALTTINIELKIPVGRRIHIYNNSIRSTIVTKIFKIGICNKSINNKNKDSKNAYKNSKKIIICFSGIFISYIIHSCIIFIPVSNI
jgi:hypothetical protein